MQPDVETRAQKQIYNKNVTSTETLFYLISLWPKPNTPGNGARERILFPLFEVLMCLLIPIVPKKKGVGKRNYIRFYIIYINFTISPYPLPISLPQRRTTHRHAFNSVWSIWCGIFLLQTPQRGGCGLTADLRSRYRSGSTDGF